MATNKSRIGIGCLVLALAQGGCGDLLTEAPRDVLTTENFYRTEADAVAAIAAAYNTLSSNEVFSRHMKSSLINASDIAAPGALAGSAVVIQTTRLSWDATNPRVTLPWDGLYRTVTRANVLIEELPGVEMADAGRAQIMGEAKFLRALAYFYLVRLYGDVPLVTTTKEQLGQPARTPKERVFEQILLDAREAAGLLPLRWNASNRGRASRGAAQVLLADVHLWRSSAEGRNEWQLAADQAKQVIDSNVFALEPVYIDAFLPGSQRRREEIFAAQASGQTGAPQILSAEIFYPRELGVNQLGGNAAAMPLPWHYASYPSGDQRFAQSFFTSAVRADGRTITFAPHIYKFRPTTRPGPQDTNWPIYRHAEALLFYAEAVNELGRPGEAVQYLNMIRARAKIPPYAGALTQSAVREALFTERRLELAFEGDRWFDLVRRGPDFFVTQLKNDSTATDVQPTDMLWPIPQTELDVNPNLTQNPGY